MSTVSVDDEILRECARALRPVADYELEPALDRRLAIWGNARSSSRPRNTPNCSTWSRLLAGVLIEKLEARVARAPPAFKIAPGVVPAP